MEEKYIKLHEAIYSMLCDFLFSKGFGYHTNDVVTKCLIDYYHHHYADMIELSVEEEINRRCRPKGLTGNGET